MDVDPAIPNVAGAYLQQALQSLQAPAGAVMLAASAIDAMLKEKGGFAQKVGMARNIL
jgi:hypothetical protein